MQQSHGLFAIAKLLVSLAIRVMCLIQINDADDGAVIGTVVRITNYEMQEFSWEEREFDSKIRWKCGNEGYTVDKLSDIRMGNGN